MRYRIEKQDYSRAPWRVLDAATGKQVWQQEIFDRPSMGLVPVDGPVCFNRKRDALAWIQAHET